VPWKPPIDLLPTRPWWPRPGVGHQSLQLPRTPPGRGVRRARPARGHGLRNHVPVSDMVT